MGLSQEFRDGFKIDPWRLIFGLSKDFLLAVVSISHCASFRPYIPLAVLRQSMVLTKLTLSAACASFLIDLVRLTFK